MKKTGNIIIIIAAICTIGGISVYSLFNLFFGNSISENNDLENTNTSQVFVSTNDKNGSNTSNTSGEIISDFESDNLRKEMAQSYADSCDYEKAIIQLKAIINHTAEIEMLMEQFTKEYNKQIISKVDNYISENKIDSAISLINDSLKVIPNNPALTELLNEIEKKKL